MYTSSDFLLFWFLLFLYLCTFFFFWISVNKKNLNLNLMLKYCHTFHDRILTLNFLDILAPCTLLARGRRISASAHKFLLQDLQKNKERNKRLKKLLADSAFLKDIPWNSALFVFRVAPGPRGVGQVTIAFAYFSITKSLRLRRLSSFLCLIFLERESSHFHVVIASEKKRA